MKGFLLPKRLMTEFFSFRYRHNGHTSYVTSAPYIGHIDPFITQWFHGMIYYLACWIHQSWLKPFTTWSATTFRWSQFVNSLAQLSRIIHCLKQKNDTVGDIWYFGWLIDVRYHSDRFEPHDDCCRRASKKERIFWLVLRLSICLQPTNGKGAVTIAALLR